MKKRTSPRSRPALCAATILAGGFAFSGEADAVTLLSENFEGASNTFAMPTYAYSSGYTLANGLTPAGGLLYAHGGAGIGGAVSTNTFSAASNPVSLLSGGFTAADVDSGGIIYNFYAQFSSYHGQVDYATVTARFLNASNATISSVDLGGQAFTAALTPAGDVNKIWAADTRSALVPVGARTVSFFVSDTKSAGGGNIDGYLDNVNFSVDRVPEAGSAVLSVAALGLLMGRRRRQS